MRTKITFIFFFLAVSLGYAQEDTTKPKEDVLAAKSPEVLSTQFKVNSIAFVEKDEKVSIEVSLTNSGDFFSYPVVQVKLGDEIVANKEGIYFLYGMSETEKFVFETDLRPQDGLELTVLIGSGSLDDAHVTKYVYLSN